MLGGCGASVAVGEAPSSAGETEWARGRAVAGEDSWDSGAVANGQRH